MMNHQHRRHPENSSNKEPCFCFLGECESVLLSLAEAFASESLAHDIFLNSSCTASFAVLFDILLEKDLSLNLGSTIVATESK